MAHLFIQYVADRIREGMGRGRQLKRYFAAVLMPFFVGNCFNVYDVHKKRSVQMDLGLLCCGRSFWCIHFIERFYGNLLIIQNYISVFLCVSRSYPIKDVTWWTLIFRFKEIRFKKILLHEWSLIMARTNNPIKQENSSCNIKKNIIQSKMLRNILGSRRHLQAFYVYRSMKISLNPK